VPPIFLGGERFYMVSSEADPNRLGGKADDSFKRIALDAAERLWLTEVYKEGIRKINRASLKVRLRDQLPRGFSPKSLEDKNLIYGEHISLLGIWHAAPQNPYVEAADKIIRCLRDILLEQRPTNTVSAHEIALRTRIEEPVVEIALTLIGDIGGFWGSGGMRPDSLGHTSVGLSQGDEALDKLIYFEGIEHELEEFYRRSQSRSSTPGRSRAKRYAEKSAPADPVSSFLDLMQMGNSNQRPSNGPLANREVWDAIQSEFGLGKQVFGKRIAFVTDKRERDILFRDVEHAYLLSRNGLSKPAIILAGSVIEELLRLHLQAKGIKPPSEKFEAYVRKCEEAGLLKSAISRLSDSVRHFRNLVHIEKEMTEGQMISKAMAQSAVASIFTIVNDFH
jgi:hypothetical protein